MAPIEIPLHPVQLYEAVYLLFLGIFILYLKYKKQSYRGNHFFVYLFLYSIGRFYIDFFRGDYRIGIFTDGQIFSIILLALMGLIYLFKKTQLKTNAVR